MQILITIGPGYVPEDGDAFDAVVSALDHFGIPAALALVQPDNVPATPETKARGTENMAKAYLKRDRQERFNLRRGWFVNAWRIVDENGCDLVQPWSSTKTEARAVCRDLGYQLVGED